jgi:hypothetical protein
LPPSESYSYSSAANVNISKHRNPSHKQAFRLTTSTPRTPAAPHTPAIHHHCPITRRLETQTKAATTHLIRRSSNRTDRAIIKRVGRRSQLIRRIHSRMELRRFRRLRWRWRLLIRPRRRQGIKRESCVAMHFGIQCLDGNWIGLSNLTHYVAFATAFWSIICAEIYSVNVNPCEIHAISL